MEGWSLESYDPFPPDAAEPATNSYRERCGEAYTCSIDVINLPRP